MTERIPHTRTSERKDFKRCVQKWQWRWRKGLVPKYTKPDALWFGTGIHLALQHRYGYPGLRRGKNVLKVWRDYVGEEMAVVYGLGEGDDEKVWDAKALGEAMLGAYLDKYGLDERWHVISAEQTAEIAIPFPMMDTRTKELMRIDRSVLTYYNAQFDLVARDLWSPDESLLLWDHKTAKAIRTHHLTLDDQAGSYWAIAGDVLAAKGLIQKGEKLDGILYNYLRKGMPDTRPKNADGLATNKPIKAHYLARLQEAGWWTPAHSKMRLDELENEAARLDLTVLGDVSKVQPAPLFLREEVWRTAPERKTQIRKIQAEALHMEAVRKGIIPVTKNPTPECAFDCPFFQMCELHDAGDAWEEYRDMAFVRLDPYAAHRESTEE